MKILVIGSTSILAEYCYQKLSKLGEVFTAARTTGANFYIDLVGNEHNISGKFDVIIHFSASFQGNTIDHIRQNILTNTLGATLIGQIAVETECQHMVYISSIFELDTSSSYGLSKKQGGEILEFTCARYGIKYTSLLFPQLYDSLGKMRKHQNFFYTVLEKIKKHQDIILNGKNDPFRNYMHVDDASEIIVHVVNKKVIGRYPCLHTETHRLSELLHKMVDVYKSSSLVSWNPQEKCLTDYPIPTDLVLYDKIGIQPKISLNDGLKLIKEQLKDYV